MTNATWRIPTWQQPWPDGATVTELRVTAGPEVEGWVPVVWSGGSGVARADQVTRDGYPRRTDDGRGMVWACCESNIGPTCEHKRD